MARVMKDSGIEWIGEIPEDWDIHTAFQLFSQVKNKNEGMQEDNLLSLSYGKIIKKNINTTEGLLPESFEGYNIIEPNDIVLRLTDLQNDHTSLRVGLSEQRGIITSAYLSLRNESDCFERYLYYQLHAFDICKGFYGMGAGVRQGLNWDGIKMLKIVRPTVAEQHRIADFLDRKCTEIDAVIEKTKATIEEYKKLKQSVITEAVTKGIRGNRPMKDSGIEWIKEIPCSWQSVKAKYVLDKLERELLPTDEIVVCSNSGKVVYRGEKNTGLVSLTENGYQGVEPGDLLIHGMDTWHGAIAVSMIRGKCTSVVHVCDSKENKQFIAYYLQSLAFRNVYKAITNGVRQNTSDYRSWEKAGTIPLILPPKVEQEEIAHFLNKRTNAIDVLISKKSDFIEEMETYKKSLIYEYVTGKTECVDVQAQTHIVYPSFPAVTGTDKPRFAQAVLMSKILDSNVKQMGRVKLEKMLYTIENSIGFDFDTEYAREAAGPLHSSIYECEGIISHKNKWFTMKQSQYGVSYTPTSSKDKYQKYYDKYFGDYDAEINRIISVFRDYTMDQAEIVATLFAAWNDAIIDQKQFTDEDIVDDVLNNWHDNKKRFAKDVWLRAMAQMKQNNIVPKGYGKRTVRRKECNA